MDEDEPIDDQSIDDQPMYDKPIELKIPKGYRYSKRRGEYYDSLVGLRKWRDGGGKRGPNRNNIIGVKPEDTVNYKSLLNIVNQQGDMIKKMMKKGSKTD
ncbi:unnamed protein product [Rhizophagus irregularis]|nr:unnamed protein product [Rhizophagus irregularis]